MSKQPSIKPDQNAFETWFAGMVKQPDSIDAMGRYGILKDACTKAWLAARHDDVSELVEAIIKDLDLWWSFCNRQQHTHSWHEKQDFMQELRKVVAGQRSLLDHTPDALAKIRGRDD